MKQFFLIMVLSIASQFAVAQWKFNISLSVNGCTGFDKTYESWANAQLKQWNTTLISGFQTKSECETARSVVLSSSVTDGKCKVQFSASPCIGSGGAVGSVDVLGVSKGSSFNSTNPINEINDWSNDDMERMLALNPEYKYEEPSYVQTNDAQFNNALVIDTSKPFRSLNVGEDGLINTHSADMSMNSLRDGFNKVEMANDFSLLANQKNVQRYVDASQGLGVPYLANPQDLSLMLQRQFQSITGYDINAIMNKMDRTDSEKQAIADYNEYVKRMCDQMISEIEQQMARIDKSEEKKQIDMAIIAKDCYDDDDKGYLGMTDYRRITSDNITDSYMKSIAETIELCNATHNETGFNAVLYYNENTGAYVIGCEGSSRPSIEIGSKYYPSMEKNDDTGDITFSLTIGGVPLSATFSKDNINDWGMNNIIQAFGGTAAQFELAHTIGNAINMLPKDVRDNLDLSITGHSLGGGLASVIGLSTGKPTYTYNAEGVSDKILNKWGLLEKKNNGDYDITAYHSSGDILTASQKTVQSIGFAILTGVENIGKQNIVAEAIGKSVNVGFHGVHQQGPMVEHFIKANAKSQSEWERIRYSRNSILAAKQDGSLQKVDHINVIFK